MHQGAFPGVLQAHRRLTHIVAGHVRRQRPVLLDVLRQVGPLNVLHDEEMGRSLAAGIQCMNDIRMIELRGHAHFALEAAHGIGMRQPIGRNDLQRHDAIHLAVPRLEDGAHTAGAEPGQQHRRPQDKSFAVALHELIDLIRRQPIALQQMPAESAAIGPGLSAEFGELVFAEQAAAAQVVEQIGRAERLCLRHRVRVGDRLAHRWAQSAKGEGKSVSFLPRLS